VGWGWGWGWGGVIYTCCFPIHPASLRAILDLRVPGKSDFLRFNKGGKKKSAGVLNSAFRYHNNNGFPPEEPAGQCGVVAAACGRAVVLTQIPKAASGGSGVGAPGLLVV
jgi:hypothetical protein